MLTDRLLHLIESHADELNTTLVGKLKSDPRTTAYRDISDDELGRRTHDVFRHLGLWLAEASDDKIRQRYVDVGRARRREGIPLSQVIAALSISRMHLWAYVKNEGLFETALELYQEIEFADLALRFFDRSIYYTALGYEEPATDG